MATHRGIIISNPVKIHKHSFECISPYLDDQLIRSVLLYWDRAIWPMGSVSSDATNPDIEFLKNIDFLFRPKVPSIVGIGSEEKSFISIALEELYIKEYLETFRLLEKGNPGCWTLSMGIDSLDIRLEPFTEKRAVIVDLFRSIPTPNLDVPFQDILEFKVKRHDELDLLRMQIDTLYERVASSGDSFLTFNRAVEEIELACKDLLTCSRESRIPFRLGSVRVAFDASLGKIVWPALAIGALTEMTVPMLSLGAIVGGASSVNLKLGLGFTPPAERKTPYDYVLKAHNSLL